MRCLACPFRDGENEEATKLQNLGCLPSAFDMIEMFDEENISLSCHDNESIPCRGLSSVRGTQHSLLKTYTDWYHGR